MCVRDKINMKFVEIVDKFGTCSESHINSSRLQGSIRKALIPLAICLNLQMFLSFIDSSTVADINRSLVSDSPQHKVGSSLPPMFCLPLSLLPSVLLFVIDIQQAYSLKAYTVSTA